MEYIVTDIQYDTDGEDINLPTEMTIDVPDDIDPGYDTNEYISDEISSRTGFCHVGFATTPEIDF